RLGLRAHRGRLDGGRAEARGRRPERRPLLRRRRGALRRRLDRARRRPRRRRRGGLRLRPVRLGLVADREARRERRERRRSLRRQRRPLGRRRHRPRRRWDDDGGPGAAWVFVRSPWGWLQQGPKLVPNDASGAAAFGDSAALSADGSTALVGGEVDRGVAGAAWVFVRAHGAWVQQGPKLTARGENGTVYFGKSVALSA